MNKGVKAAALCVATWLGPALVALVVLAIGAALTSDLSASKVGPVMLGLIAADLLVFGLGSLLLWLGLGRLVESGVHRMLIVGLHGFVQLGTCALLAFVSLIVFNR